MAKNLAENWNVTYAVALETATHEALVRETYYDSVKKPTWNFGMTNATGHRVDLKGRYWGTKAGYEHCMRLFVWALENYSDQVREAFQGVYLTEEQFAAAVSFHWNTGAIKRATWVKSFCAGRVSDAYDEFMNWSSPPEIIPRRKKERDLFFHGRWSQTGTITEWTRVKSNGHIDWGSGKRIDIRPALEEAMRPAEETAGVAPMPLPKPIIDQAPQPDAPVDVPTLSPVEPKNNETEAKGAAGLGALGAMVAFLTGGDGGVTLLQLLLTFGLLAIVGWLVLRYYNRRNPEAEA